MRLVRDQLAGTRKLGRWQTLAGEFGKFGTIGVINAAINYAVFNALILTILPQGQLKATIIATVVATTASYFMNRHWTFRDRERSALRKEYLLFFAFNLAGLAMELSVMALAKYGLGLTGVIALNLAKTVGVGLGTIFRFWAYRTFVFLPKPPDTAENADATDGHAPEVAAAPGATAPAAAPAVPTVASEVTEEVEVLGWEFDELTGSLEAEFADQLDHADKKLDPAPATRRS